MWATISAVGWWPWRRRQQQGQPSASASAADPALIQYLGLTPPVDAGVDVNEGTVLGLSAVWRSISLIASTTAALPMPTLRNTGDGMKQRLGSIFDTPGGPDSDGGPTAFEWRETMLAHLLLWGNSYHVHRYNAAGGLYSLEAVHPACVSVEPWTRASGEERPPGGKWFRILLDDGTTARLTARTVLHIPALSTDGLMGLSPISVARQSLGTTIAGDRAAGRTFGQGALIRGVLTPEDELDPDEADAIRNEVNAEIVGWERAAAVKVINRRLKFSPWSMSLADAQFLQSREFQIEEIARWYGVPPFALMQTTKQTSWGTGIAEQQRGLSRTVLAPWATRIEQRCSRLLPSPRYVQFDFSGLERPNPEAEDAMLIARVNAGLMTPDEYRAYRGWPPLPGGAGAAAKGQPAPAAPAEAPDDEEVPA